MKGDSLSDLLQDVAACDMCGIHLPLGPRPVVRMTETARLLIIGQAPGTRVHETGIPWNDASGDRLRDWLGMDRDVFYDSRRIAIMPMGFCYSGRASGGGDNPPRPECAPKWHQALRRHLPRIALTLLVGSYAQKYYLEAGRRTVADTVRNSRQALAQGYLPLPHPSWRTTAWQRRHPWFEEEVLPDLRRRVHTLLQEEQA